MELKEKKRIKISVRNLVEFVMKSGDIDNRRTAGADREAMQAGSRIHRKIQRRMGSDYQAEVPLKTIVEKEQYEIVVEGRADGIIRRTGEIIIDEIKGVYMDLARLKQRSLSRKRSLALKEFSLGLEALERFAAKEPLYRVHECVFAILALESEPVDAAL